MLSWKIRAAAVASAVVILGASASVSAAQAAPITSHYKHFGLLKLPKQLQGRIAHERTQDLPGNVMLNADVLIEVDNAASGDLAAEGHLSLHHKKGTAYTGTFVDNYGKGHKYKASATGVSTTDETGNFTVKSKNGTLKFSLVDGAQVSPTKAPKKYGKESVTLFDVALPHSYTLNPSLIAIIAGQQVGQYRAPVEGSLTLTTDSLNWVVPHIKHVSKSSFAYIHFPSSKPKTANITAWGYYRPSDGADDGFLQFSVTAHSTKYSVYANEDDSDTDEGLTNPLTGNATAGSGGSFFNTDFTAGIPSTI